jgi:hypothetical protein
VEQFGLWDRAVGAVGWNSLGCGIEQLGLWGGTVWDVGESQLGFWRRTEPEFLNFKGAQESIPRNQFRQTM